MAHEEPARILVAEDERALREAIVRALRGHGYLADGARSVEQALERLAGARYAVLVTDLRLSGADSGELIARARERDPALRVLLITADQGVRSTADAERLGAHDFLPKPLLLDDVAHRVALLLELRRLAEDNVALRAALEAKGSVAES